MLGGVCSGVAAYFNIDVVWVRVAFVLLTLITGVWVLVWLVMLFVMPRAVAPEDIALAHGSPFNAQDVINRAKKKYDEVSVAAAELGRREWARHEPTIKNTAADLKKGFENLGAKFRSGSSGTHQRSRYVAPRSEVPVSYGAQVLAGLALPVFSVVSAAALVTVLALFVLLSDPRSVIGWLPEVGAPQWLLFVAVGVVYLIVALPIGAARRASQRYANGGSRFGRANVLDSIFWVSLVIIFGWIVYRHTPGFAESLARLIESSFPAVTYVSA
jgi:phage shock protein PspC (stress-responsive transcriptional regulator)